MTSIDLLVDAFDRVHGAVKPVVAGASLDVLSYRPDPAANTIAWLVWHLSRVQDDHIADASGGEQQWTAGGWAGRFGLPFDESATGYGQSAADVAAVRVEAELLAGYHEAVTARTVEYLRTLSDADLDRVVDTSWDPPVTLAVRLVSIVSDDLQHAGQAAYLRGLAKRAGV